MTRTTELLKRIEEHEKRTCCMYVTGRNELKGRLDALKEEVDNLQFIKDDIGADWRQRYEQRLASIREEIKLIESAGVGK
jgi:hypothetical protein